MSKNSDKFSSKNIELEDAILKAICETYVSTIIEELNDKSELINNSIQATPSIKDWSHKLSNKKIKKRGQLNTRKAAIFLLIILGAFSVTTMTVEAIRIKIVDFIIEINNEYTKFYRAENIVSMSDPKLEFDRYYYPSILPSGYQFQKHTSYHDVITLFYTNGTETIVFIQTEGSGDYHLDTENAEVTKVAIDEYFGYAIIRDNDTNILFWHNEKAEFIVKGNLKLDNLVKIAENLKENNK